MNGGMVVDGAAQNLKHGSDVACFICHLLNWHSVDGVTRGRIGSCLQTLVRC